MDTLWLHGAGGASARSLELTERPVTVGRSGDLRIEDDGVEKKHARFVRRDGKIFVAPLGRADVAVGEQPISAESEVKPGDVVLLSAAAAIFVAADAEQAPSKRARDAVSRLASYQRDRVLVRLLSLPSAGLVAVVREKLGTIPAARLRAVAGVLRQVQEAVAGQPPEAPVHTLLERLLREATSDQPIPPTEAALREQERNRLRAAEAAPPPPPIDEEADPEQSAGTGAPTRAWHLVPSPQDIGHGFSGGVPPISAAAWPRSPRDGAPMKHLGTLLVPAEYRVAGPDRVAIALFQADDHTTRPIDGAPRHAGDAGILEDGIGGTYGLIWLDRETFQQGQGREVPGGVAPSPPRPLVLRARLGDPNVGLVIPDWDDDDDASPYVKLGTPQWDALALSRYDFQTSRALAHFGGTSVACDNFAGGLGPFYLGIEHSFGGANFGGGNAVLDLAQKKIEFGS